MIQGVRVHSLALRELKEAAHDYRDESQQLAEELVEEVLEALALIVEFPRIGPVDEEPVRIFSLETFPLPAPLRDPGGSNDLFCCVWASQKKAEILGRALIDAQS